MTTRLLALAALALGLAAAAPVARADDKTDNARLRADAARRVYESLWIPSSLKTLDGKGIQGGTANLDRAYLWSRRWMEAEQELSDKTEGKIAAAQAHLDRMRKVEDYVKVQVELRSATAADVAAQEYYRLEAERRGAGARQITGRWAAAPMSRGQKNTLAPSPFKSCSVITRRIARAILPPPMADGSIGEDGE